MSYAKLTLIFFEYRNNGPDVFQLYENARKKKSTLVITFSNLAVKTVFTKLSLISLHLMSPYTIESLHKCSVGVIIYPGIS